MPRLQGVRDRRHQPLWDTVVLAMEDLPCDLWLVGQPVVHVSTRPFSILVSLPEVDPDDPDPEELIIVDPDDPRVMLWTSVKHEYPVIRPVEIKCIPPEPEWTAVAEDGWRQLADLH